MIYHFDEYQLSVLLTSAAKMGASMLAVEQGLIKTKINKAEACRRYTRRLVDKWVNEHKITPVKIKGTTLFSVKELEAVSNINDLYNRHLSVEGNKQKAG